MGMAISSWPFLIENYKNSHFYIFERIWAREICLHDLARGLSSLNGGYFTRIEQSSGRNPSLELMGTKGFDWNSDVIWNIRDLSRKPKRPQSAVKIWLFWTKTIVEDRRNAYIAPSLVEHHRPHSPLNSIGMITFLKKHNRKSNQTSGR